MRRSGPGRVGRSSPLLLPRRNVSSWEHLSCARVSNPALLAKMAATVDGIGNWRLTLDWAPGTMNSSIAPSGTRSTTE